VGVGRNLSFVFLDSIRGVPFIRSPFTVIAGGDERDGALDKDMLV
jgi:hypothetical protein